MCPTLQAKFYLCGGKCLSIRASCNATCPNPDYPQLCGSSCIEADEKEKYNCDGECRSTSKPCKGNCSNPGLPKLCNKECVAEDSPRFQDCDGKCISSEVPCHGKCEKWLTLCDNRCLPEQICQINAEGRIQNSQSKETESEEKKTVSPN